jgi:hypothetical protein
MAEIPEVCVQGDGKSFGIAWEEAASCGDAESAPRSGNDVLAYAATALD